MDNGVGLIQNENSAIGGIVGLFNGGEITNTSVEGNIGFISNSEICGANNNVGGIVGLAKNENDEF